MEPITIVTLIASMIDTAKAAYKFLQEIKGEAEIPTWDELLAGNTEFQKKIDAEKEA